MQENISNEGFFPHYHPSGHGGELPVLLLGQAELCVNVLATASRVWKCFSFQH